jgi:hypothetical protein
VPPHNLRKRAFIARDDEPAEQDDIGVFRHGFPLATAERKTEQTISRRLRATPPPHVTVRTRLVRVRAQVRL